MTVALRQNKYRLTKPVCFLLLLVGLAACATSPGADTTSIASPPSGVTESHVLGTLAPQALDEGTCGLFLWTVEAVPRLVFFSSAGQPSLVQIGGREIQLNRTSQSSSVAEPVGKTVQSFRSVDGAYGVVVTTPEPTKLEGGALVRHASIRLMRMQDGWEAIVPVGGLVACK